MATDFHSSLRELRRSLAAGLLTGVSLLAVIVLSRRVVGAALGIESPMLVCLLAGAVMLVGVLSGVTLRPASRSDDFATALLSNSICGLPGLALGLALSPAQEAGTLTALIGEYLILVLASSSDKFDRTHVRRSNPVAYASTQSTSSKQSASPEARSISDQELMTADIQRIPVICDEQTESLLGETNSEFDLDDIEGDEPTIAFKIDARVVQWMQRALREDQDIVEGGVKVTLPIGAKQFAVHIPFAPAFNSVPTFEAEPLDASDVEIHQTSVHSYGVRFEIVRRMGLDRALQVEIGYLASAPLAEAIAA